MTAHTEGCNPADVVTHKIEHAQSVEAMPVPQPAPAWKPASSTVSEHDAPQYAQSAECRDTAHSTTYLGLEPGRWAVLACTESSMLLMLRFSRLVKFISSSRPVHTHVHGQNCAESCGIASSSSCPDLEPGE